MNAAGVEWLAMSDTSEHEITAVPSDGQVETGAGPRPHPVLDIPLEEEKFTRSHGIDWAVFGVTAVIAVGLLVWGFVSTDTLATARAARWPGSWTRPAGCSS